MSSPFKYILSIAALTAAFTLSANASFVPEPTPIAEPPHSEKLFFDAHHAGVTGFDGTVGGQHTGPVVHISTGNGTDRVTSGAGWANIKPARNNTLTDLIFTPADDTLFGDFTFRGQLTASALGIVHVTVTDQNGSVQMFTFSGLGANTDFHRIGIISTDETIRSVELTAGGSGFKEIKQIAFSPAGVVPPVPDGGATVMLLGAALGVLGVARRYLKS